MLSKEKVAPLLADVGVAAGFVGLHAVAQIVNEIAGAATSVVALAYFSVRFYRYLSRKSSP
jgi:hypothetical protein